VLRIAAKLPQLTVNNLIGVGNYEIVTMTCTNLLKAPFYCKE